MLSFLHKLNLFFLNGLSTITIIANTVTYSIYQQSNVSSHSEQINKIISVEVDHCIQSKHCANRFKKEQITEEAEEAEEQENYNFNLQDYNYSPYDLNETLNSNSNSNLNLNSSSIPVVPAKPNGHNSQMYMPSLLNTSLNTIPNLNFNNNRPVDLDINKTSSFDRFIVDNNFNSNFNSNLNSNLSSFLTKTDGFSLSSSNSHINTIPDTVTTTTTTATIRTSLHLNLPSIVSAYTPTTSSASSQVIPVYEIPESPTSIPVPTPIPTPIPTAIPTPVPTAIPTPVPTAIPTPVPTAIPTPVPTAIPTTTPILLSCPENFVKVEEVAPKNGFCVSYIEGRQGGGDTLLFDKPNQKPWVNISATDAEKKCQSLGSKYDLINNYEWMIIARKIEMEDSNWTSNTIGSEATYIGHSDNDPNKEIAIQNNDSEGYSNTKNSATNSLGSGKEQRRHFIINEQKVWDFAGNVWEWVKLSIEESYDIFDVTCLPVFDNFASTSCNLSSQGPLYDTVPYSSGGIWASSIKYLRRGGAFDSLNYSGIYAINFELDHNGSEGNTGFRCVYHP